MPFQTWVETIVYAGSDGTAVTNSTTETTVLPGNSSIVLPSNFFDHVGQTLEMELWGRASTVVTTPGTLTFKIKLGGTGASGTAVATSGAIALTTTAQTNVTWRLKWGLQLRTTGNVASFMHGGQFTSSVLNNSTTAPSDLLFPATAMAVGSTFDARSSQQFDVTATWSVANAANSIQSHMVYVKALN